MTSPDQLAQYLFSGITIGSIYALIALGFTIIYNTTGIINFAQGEFVMLGGMCMVGCTHILRLPVPAGVLISVACVVVVGLLIERLSIRPAHGASVVTLIIITIGVSITLKALTAFITKDSFTYPPFPGPEHVRIFGASMPGQSLWIIGAACCIMVLLSLFFHFTIRGKAMRACAINREAAYIVGIDVETMSFLSFGLSALIGAVAGIMVTPTTQMAWYRGMDLGLKGFCAAILGGLGSSPGAVAGGLLLGLLETFGSFFVSGYKDAIAFALFLLVLFIRPRGITGRGR
ncbi:MAG: branched-chain amino acid ABC transporter permease [Desulfobacterota bacterium]|nr:branched-chain amino acid ABC transporter permease [Thermodesulfobacteriota bacterium]